MIPPEIEPSDPQKFKIAGIGEVLWDVLPAGPRIGGAPGNFASHMHAMGASAQLVSRVGNDALGLKIIRELEAFGVATCCISIDPTHPTGTVTVELSADGQPCFTIREGVAWDHLVLEPQTAERMKVIDAVCFGTLAQRCEPSRSAIRALVGSTSPQALRVFDANLRQDFYSADLLHESLLLANVLKLSDVELPIVAGLLDIGGSDREKLTALCKRYELKLVACTCSADGSILCSETEWQKHRALPTTVKDTVGAGDSFTAALTMGLLLQWPIEKIGAIANEVAAHVCSCDGATPELPASIRAHFEPESNILSYA